jgi:hypothetical protein
VKQWYPAKNADTAARITLVARPAAVAAVPWPVARASPALLMAQRNPQTRDLSASSSCSSASETRRRRQSNQQCNSVLSLSTRLYVYGGIAWLCARRWMVGRSRAGKLDRMDERTID